MIDPINQLACNMVDRKKSESKPYTIFLGAGASINSGCPSMAKLVDEFLKLRQPDDFANWEREIKNAYEKDEEFGKFKKRDIAEIKRRQFFELWKFSDSETQFSFLKDQFHGKKPSDGYQILIKLAKQKYIDTIITTNIDLLLERTLQENGLIQGSDYMICVNGQDKPEIIKSRFQQRTTPLVIVKLHGTLETPESYAFTDREIFNFEEKLQPVLSELVNESLIIIGYSGQDRDVDILFKQEGKEIYFIAPELPAGNSRIASVLEVRSKGFKIIGEDGYFDKFFSKLNQSIIKISASSVGECIEENSLEAFLVSIGFKSEIKQQQSRFKNLDTLYVRPKEYDSILQKLEEDRVIFIIGEPHIGKTYTAIYLLWQYFQKGFQALHYNQDNLKERMYEDKYRIEETLNKIIQPNTIVHLDDPFGSTQHERIDAFEKYFAYLIDNVYRQKSSYLIITSRFNIFEEAKRYIERSKDLSHWEQELRVHTSYDKQMLGQIYDRYLALYKPQWSQDAELASKIKNRVLEKLSAPHNIQWFVLNSEGMSSLKELEDHVEKSNQLLEALSNWFVTLSDVEQIFISLVVLFTEIDKRKTVYEHESRIEFMQILFENMLGDFYKKRWLLTSISISSWSDCVERFSRILIKREELMNNFNFVHPSYIDAFWKTINEKSNLYEAWIRISSYLIESEQVKHLVYLARNYFYVKNRKSPLYLENYIKIKKHLSNDVRESIIQSLIENFDKTDNWFQDELEEFSKDGYERIRTKIISFLLREGYDSDKNNFRLIKRLCEDPNENVRIAAATELINKYSSLQSETQKYVLKLSKDHNENVRGSVVNGILRNYNQLPNNLKLLLNFLIKDRHEKVRTSFISPLLELYKIYPNEIQDFLIKLKDDNHEHVRSEMASRILKYYEQLPNEIKNYVYKFANDPHENVRQQVANKILWYYHILDNQVQSLLEKLAIDQDSSVRKFLLRPLIEQYSKYPKNVQQILHTLKNDRSSAVRQEIAVYIIENYPLLPSSIQSWVSEFAEDVHEDVRAIVANRILWNYHILPKELTDTIFKLINDKHEKVKSYFPVPLLQKYSQYPYYTQSLLNQLKLDQSELIRKEMIHRIIDYYHLLPEDIQSWISDFSKDLNEEVRAQLLKVLLENFIQLPDEIRSIVFILMEDKYPSVRKNAIEPLIKMYNSYPSELKDRLANLKTDKHEDVRSTLVTEIINYYHNLPTEIQKWIFDFSSDLHKDVRAQLLSSILYNYFRLPEKVRYLINELIIDECGFVRRHAISPILKRYPELPSKLQKKLANLKNDSNEVVRLELAQDILLNYISLPEGVRYWILELACDPHKYVRRQVANKILWKYHKIDDDLKFLVNKLLTDKDESVRAYLVRPLIENYFDYPEEIKQMLNKLRNDMSSSVREELVESILVNYHILPSKIQRWIFDLWNDQHEDVRAKAVQSILKHFNILPEEIRLLLDTLIVDGHEKVRASFIYPIVNGYHKFQPKIQNLLFQLRDDQHELISSELLSGIIWNFNKIPDGIKNWPIQLLSKGSNTGLIYYHFLSSIIINFDFLPQQLTNMFFEIVNDPPHWIVGGIFGHVMSNDDFLKIKDEIKLLPFNIYKNRDKQLVGTLLAEMCQVDCDKDNWGGLNVKYRPLLDELIRDPEIVKFANEYYEYEKKVFKWFDSDYWKKVEAHLMNLVENT